MAPVLDVYADVGRSAAGISLRFVRIAQDRETQRDRDALAAIVETLTQASEGEVKLESEYPLFSSIDGLFVLADATRESRDLTANGLKDRLKEIAGMIKDIIPSGADRRCERATVLQGVFREAHDYAEEITVTGLRKNPVVELFNALA